MNTYRQGDVLLIPVTTIPTNLVKTKMVTLALGEVTGHHHTINYGAVGYGDQYDSLAEFVQVVDESATLTHQEHGEIQLPKGMYRSVIQSEYTPAAIKNVAD